jgi:hypothetical protein
VARLGDARNAYIIFVGTLLEHRGEDEKITLRQILRIYVVRM